MPRPNPFSNADLLQHLAPWCEPLDNLEMALILLALPWINRGGSSCAELERQTSALSQQLPLGEVYFQRVRRAIGKLEASGRLRRLDDRRSSHYSTTPEGLAALLLNLAVLRDDPTLDGGEFELKRSLLALWGHVLDHARELPDELGLDPEIESFFDRLEAVELMGRPVVTDELLTQSLSVLRLIELQRQRVTALRQEREARLTVLSEPETESSALPFSRALELGTVAQALRDSPEAAAVVLKLASTTLPARELEASIRRYDAYLDYLRELTGLYSSESVAANLSSTREVLAGRSRAS